MTPSERSNCRRPDLAGTTAYKDHGCRCARCRAAYAAYKREWRERNGAAVEREREASRRWKRIHLGQPGRAAQT